MEEILCMRFVIVAIAKNVINGCKDKGGVRIEKYDTGKKKNCDVGIGKMIVSDWQECYNLSIKFTTKRGAHAMQKMRHVQG